LYLGGTFHFIQQKHWFLALKANYRWAQNSEIGTYSIDTSESEFDMSKINLKSFDIGIMVGIRIGNDD
jgi:hypothetical protein